MSESHKQSIATMRTGLIEKCVDILYVYRKYCATSTSSGQLILPESLKLLPIYILSLIKNTVLKQSADIHADERAYLFSLLNSMPVALSTPFIYPRLFALHHMSPEVTLYTCHSRLMTCVSVVRMMRKA
jgi:protein transport protein SEC24